MKKPEPGDWMTMVKCPGDKRFKPVFVGTKMGADNKAKIVRRQQVGKRKGERCRVKLEVETGQMPLFGRRRRKR